MNLIMYLLLSIIPTFSESKVKPFMAAVYIVMNKKTKQ